MSLAILMNYINITDFVLIIHLEKDHNMIETYYFKTVSIFFSTFAKFSPCKITNTVFAISN